MWVIKLGGSWITNPRLKELIHKLYYFRDAPIILLLGGGKFVDSIRFAHKYIKFDEELAHKLSVKATETYARIIENVVPEKVTFTYKLNELTKKKKLEIFFPYDELNKDKLFKKNWNSTSDSIACWVAKKLQCRGVIFIKSVSFKEITSCNLDRLQKNGILDRNMHNYIKSNMSLKIVGPEIFEKINELKVWNKLIYYLTKIEWKKTNK